MIRANKLKLNYDEMDALWIGGSGILDGISPLPKDKRIVWMHLCQRALSDLGGLKCFWPALVGLATMTFAGKQ